MPLYPSPPTYTCLMPKKDRIERLYEDHEIWALRAKGHSVAGIAQITGCSAQKVRLSLSRVAEEYKVESAAEIIKMELDRLDIMLVKAMEVLEDKYTAYSHGKMMTDQEGTPVPDPGPTLKAIDAVLKIMDRRSKYLGLDAPTKSEQAINVHHAPNEADLAVLELINDFKQKAAALTPEQLEQASNQPALPQQPQHQTITLPADHFTDTSDYHQPEEAISEHAAP